MSSFKVEYNWKEYNKDTEYVVGYLLKTSQKCGYKRHMSNTRLRGYNIHFSEFRIMAQCVAKHASSVKIPEYINTIFVRAIRYRCEVTSWYRTRGTDSGKDA
jgi:hypothetical protein